MRMASPENLLKEIECNTTLFSDRKIIQFSLCRANFTGDPPDRNVYLNLWSHGLIRKVYLFSAVLHVLPFEK